MENTTETNTVEAEVEAVEAAGEMRMQIVANSHLLEADPTMICEISSVASTGNPTELTTILTPIPKMDG